MNAGRTNGNASPSTVFKRRFASMTLEDRNSVARVQNPFYLPPINKEYLAEHTFDDWEGAWERQKKFNDTLNEIVYVQIPMSRKFWNNVYNMELGVTHSLI